MLRAGSLALALCLVSPGQNERDPPRELQVRHVLVLDRATVLAGVLSGNPVAVLLRRQLRHQPLAGVHAQFGTGDPLRICTRAVLGDDRGAGEFASSVQKASTIRPPGSKTR